MTMRNLSHLHLGLDLDQTLFDPYPRICSRIEELHDVRLEATDLTDYNLTIPQTDGVALSDVIHELHDERDFIQDMEPLPGAVDTVQALHDAGAYISIVTHRKEHTFDWSRDALAANNIPYDNFIEDVPRNKADVNADLDVLVDDLGDMVLGMAESGSHGVLFLRPHNTVGIPNHDNVYTPTPQGCLPDEVVTEPAKQWAQIEQIIADIAVDGSE